MKHYSKISCQATRKKKTVEPEPELDVEVSLPIHEAVLFPISWLFCPSLEAVKDMLKEHGIDDEGKIANIIRDDVPAFVIPLETDNDMRCIVYITSEGVERNRISDLAALIAHEANHVVMNGLDFIGETEPSDELVAYFQQYVTQTIMSDYFEYHNLEDKLHG